MRELIKKYLKEKTTEKNEANVDNDEDEIEVLKTVPLELILLPEGWEFV